MYARVPHITLKSIANNAEIDEIYARYQAILDPLRQQINQALGTSYEEWEMPKHPTPNPSPTGRRVSPLPCRRGGGGEVSA